MKLFFDACLSKRLPRVIEAAYKEDYPELQVRHLTEFFMGDDADEDWLPLIQQDGGWIVVTADRGTDPKKEKLPLLCARLGVTHVSFTTHFHRAGYRAHKQAMLSLIPQIADLGMLPKGTRVSLGFRAYHERQLPYLLVDGHPVDAWCLRKGIRLAGMMPPPPPSPPPPQTSQPSLPSASSTQVPLL